MRKISLHPLPLVPIGTIPLLLFLFLFLFLSSFFLSSLFFLSSFSLLSSFSFSFYLLSLWMGMNELLSDFFFIFFFIFLFVLSFLCVFMSQFEEDFRIFCMFLSFVFRFSGVRRPYAAGLLPIRLNGLPSSLFFYYNFYFIIYLFVFILRVFIL